MESSADGRIEIRFTENNLEAYANFFPPQKSGKPITSDYINYVLDNENIHFGVDWDTVQSSALQCNTRMEPIFDVLLAKGERPVDQISEYYQVIPQPSIRPPEPKGNYRLDYKQFSPYTVVKEGQRLATFMPAVPGKEGKNVLGDVLQFRTINPSGVSVGENTKTDDKGIYAAIAGQLIESNHSLNVYPSLQIKGSIGYGTGHINFPGDITINGEVADGFKIYSGGSIAVKQTIDVTEIMCKGNLLVGAGISGREPGLVKVNGGIKTKFIQSCRVACRQKVMVMSSVTNSTIFTMADLEMGEKGSISGSDIWAIHGVKTMNIGGGGKPTKIHCGMDWTVQQEMNRIKEQLRILSGKLRQANDIIDANKLNAKAMANVKNSAMEMEAEERSLNAKLTGLMDKIYADTNAIVVVSGDLAADTLIEICEASFYVTEPLKRVRIRLDKATSSLISEGLQ
jgi:uncharacterized protein (DUF342 family)